MPLLHQNNLFKIITASFCSIILDDASIGFLHKVGYKMNLVDSVQTAV